MNNMIADVVEIFVVCRYAYAEYCALFLVRWRGGWEEKRGMRRMRDGAHIETDTITVWRINNIK